MSHLHFIAKFEDVKSIYSNFIYEADYIVFIPVRSEHCITHNEEYKHIFHPNSERHIFPHLLVTKHDHNH